MSKEKSFIFKFATLLLIATITITLILFSVVGAFNLREYKLANKTIIGVSEVCEKYGVRFIQNKDESILKNNGYMGSIEKRNSDGTYSYKDLYTICADNNKISTQCLTFDMLDYSMFEEEVVSFLSSNTDSKKIENFCQSVVQIYYKNRTRGTIDLKVTKQYVDGSGELAPHINIWDIKSEMIISTCKAGLDEHTIVEVAPIFLIGEDIINVTPVYTNANNTTITLTEGTSHNIQIQAGKEYDDRVSNTQVGLTYNFQYGESRSYTFTQGSYSEIKDSNLYWNIWGTNLDGVRYRATPNGNNITRMNHEMVQRVAYYDNDDDPDNLAAFVGIAGIKINGKVFAPDLTLGYDSNNNIANNTVAFAICLGWKSDNSAHSYMANVINYDELPISNSYSNLPEDTWEHSYGYGY